MRLRHLAVLSLVVIALPVAACIGDDPAIVVRGGPDSGGDDASSGAASDGALSSSDASPGSDAGASDADAAPPVTCPAAGFGFNEAAFETQLGGSFKGPGVRQNACTPGDITQLEANFQNATIKTLSGYTAGVGAACKACAFTPASETRWGPLVMRVSDPTSGYVNWGACYAAITGSTACGKALTYEQACVQLACESCPEPERDSCRQTGAPADGACAKETLARKAACPDVTQAEATCGNTLMQHLKTLCAFAPP